MSALDTHALNEYRTRGFVVIKGAFDRKAAAECCARILEALQTEAGIDLQSPKEARYIVTRRRGAVFDRMITETVTGALDDLLGAGVWDSSHLESHGAFFVTFPGFHGVQWRPPFGVGRWHIDYGYEFRSRFVLEDGNCAAVPIFLLTSTDPGGGATLAVPGSHAMIARWLRALNEPVPRDMLVAFCEALMYCQEDAPPVVELIGEAGDLVIMHPLLVHCPSPNVTPQIRIMCNTGIGLRGPRRFNDDGPHTPTDDSIRAALAGCDTSVRTQTSLRAMARFSYALWKARYRLHGGLPALTEPEVPLHRWASERALRLIAAKLARRMHEIVL